MTKRKEQLQFILTIFIIDIILLTIGNVFNHQSIFGLVSGSDLMFFGFPISAYIVYDISVILIFVASLIPLMAFPLYYYVRGK